MTLRRPGERHRRFKWNQSHKAGSLQAVQDKSGLLYESVLRYDLSTQHGLSKAVSDFFVNTK